ncbi:MAG: hypothetical protein ABSB31_08510 [Dehalococcoidia bacterium]|jgi:hypothetical protein
MHALDGPRLKVARAKAEIDRLGTMEDAFTQNTRYHIVRAEFNPKSGKYVWRVSVDGLPPSLEWGIYIGEIAHNLRSALNQLVYQLALLERPNIPKTVARNLQWPIARCRKEFKNRKGKQMLELLRSKHKAIIERLQPYKRRGSVDFVSLNRAEYRGCNSPLFWLNEINNADKHRLIQVVGAKTAIGPVIGRLRTSDIIDLSDISLGRIRILKDGAKFEEYASHVYVDSEIIPLIAFAHGCKAVAGRGVIFVLDLITKHVSEIVEGFASEFPDRLRH